MRDLGALSAPIVVGVILLIIFGVALIYVLSRRLNSAQHRAGGDGVAAEPAIMADGVLAVNQLSVEVRSLREAVRELRSTIQSKALTGAVGAPSFRPGQPFVATVRGIANLEHLVQLEHAFEGLEAVEMVGIQTYRQGRGDFVVRLKEPLEAETLRSAVAAAVGAQVTIDSADPDQGRIELRINA
jgi:hypothetical protein